MARLLVVSNRLPVTVHAGNSGGELRPSPGGLATGLRATHERGEGSWIGWPGPTEGLSRDERESVLSSLRASRLIPIELSADEVRRYYESYANGTLWPLFHYQTHALPLDVCDFDAYEAVNERFADTVAKEWRPGDRVWIHDYQLLLLPEMLRRRIPDVRAGFFLHIPFPSSEVFRALPQRDRILEGMLGADLVGFHTASYARHFASNVLRALGVQPEVDRVQWAGRDVRLGVFPMGVDAGDFADAAQAPEVQREVAALRGDGEIRLLLGIDRLDYTKGIPRRLLAFERLLQRHPELRGRVRLVQVAVPSRGDVEAYQTFRSQTDELIGRILGAFATPHWVPVHWIHRALTRQEIVALYRAADVMLVTPLRDGMNLVAKEFVASRADEDGVLVLSEFAGAASELAEALHVNPYDVDATAEAYRVALTLPLPQRRRRMQALRRRVLAYDVHRWARAFLAALEDAGSVTPPSLRPTSATALRTLAAELRGTPLALLLDYDGTLVPLSPSPWLATPDDPLRALLTALAERPATEVHVVSGRPYQVIEEWLGDLPVWLHAEHGLWSRGRPPSAWETLDIPPGAWREPVLAILEEFATRTPGALVEEKTRSLAFHWRGADPEFGGRQANELQLHLHEVLSNLPVEVLPGNHLIEVRPHGIHKGRIVAPLVGRIAAGTRIVALGDDRTDEDLFAALPAEAVAIHVGPSASAAPWRLAGVREAHDFLRSLLAPSAAAA